MRARGWSSGQCIFCAFRSQPWPARSPAPLQRASFTATTASLKPKDRSSGPGFKRLRLHEKLSPEPIKRNTLRLRIAKNPEAFLKVFDDSFDKATNSRRREQVLPGTHDKWNDYKKALLAELQKPADSSELWEDTEEYAKPMGQLVRDAYCDSGPSGLIREILNQYPRYLLTTVFTKSEIENQRAIADLRYPSEWFPNTRSRKRKVHLHVGPTNSGKTYHALKRLEQARSGVYGGPLRLLAHEVFTRMNAKDIPCALVTGEERRKPNSEKTPSLYSCTVEMVPVHTEVEVAVIDEIQMIGHSERGWAWTQAFLGVMAQEVHLCGEERAVPLIQELCGAIGDDLEIHHYNRLSPLKMEGRSLRGDLNKLQKGDAIICFSILGIHSMKREIEQTTGKKVAIVYGSLPPETRAQQARLFNDPDNDYDILVASDAIGMGLNLSIKRIIFEASGKSNGTHFRPLAIPEVKQIAGRAGRYRTADQASEEHKDNAVTTIDNKPASSVGLVTTLEEFDYKYIAKKMSDEAAPLETAGLFPPDSLVERFANYFPPGTPFSYIVGRLYDISRIHPRFHLCSLKDQLVIADTIEPVKNLTIADRLTFLAAPAGTREEQERTLLRNLAQCVADQKGGSILDIKDFDFELLDKDLDRLENNDVRPHLRKLEHLHKSLTLYLWLSYRFSGVFTTRALASHAKALTEDAVEKCLSQYSFSKRQLENIRKMRQQKLLDSLSQDIAELKSDVPWSEKKAHQRLGDGKGSSERNEKVIAEFNRLIGFMNQGPDSKVSAVDRRAESSRPQNEESLPEDDVGRFPAPELDADFENSAEQASQGKEERPSQASGTT